MTKSNQEQSGRKLLRLVVKEMTRRLETPEEASQMSAAEFAVIVKLTTDNGVTLADVQAGDFGKVAADVAAELAVSNNLPFDVDNMPKVN